MRPSSNSNAMQVAAPTFGNAGQLNKSWAGADLGSDLTAFGVKSENPVNNKVIASMAGMLADRRIDNPFIQKYKNWKQAYNEYGMTPDQLLYTQYANQTGATKWGNAAAQFFGRMLPELWSGVGSLETFIPTAVKEVAKAINNGEDIEWLNEIMDILAAPGNFMINTGNAGTEWVNQKAPIYTNPYWDNSSMSTFEKMIGKDGALAWWASNAPSLSTALTSIAPIIGEGKMMIQLGKLAQTAANAGKGGALVKALAAGGRARNSAAGTILAGGLLGTHLDVTMETSRQYDQMVEQLKREREEGQNSMTDKEIEKTASDIASESYRIGYTGEVLGNMLMFATLTGAGSKILNRAAMRQNGVVNGIREYVQQAVHKGTPLNITEMAAAAGAKTAKKTAGKVAGVLGDMTKLFLVEGWEELWIDYALMKGEQAGRTKNGLVADQTYQGMDGFIKYISDGSKYDSFFWGGIGGLFAGGIVGASNRSRNGGLKSIFHNNTEAREKAVIDSIVGSASNIIDSFSMINNIIENNMNNRPDDIVKVRLPDGSIVDYTYQDSEGNTQPYTNTESALNQITHDLIKNITATSARNGTMVSLANLFSEMAKANNLETLNLDIKDPDQAAKVRNSIEMMSNEMQNALDIYKKQLSVSHGYGQEMDYKINLALADARHSLQYWNNALPDIKSEIDQIKNDYINSLTIFDPNSEMVLRLSDNINNAERERNNYENEVKVLNERIRQNDEHITEQNKHIDEIREELKKETDIHKIINIRERLSAAKASARIMMADAFTLNNSRTSAINDMNNADAAAKQATIDYWNYVNTTTRKQDLVKPDFWDDFENTNADFRNTLQHLNSIVQERNRYKRVIDNLTDKTKKQEFVNAMKDIEQYAREVEIAKLNDEIINISTDDELSKARDKIRNSGLKESDFKDAITTAKDNISRRKEAERIADEAKRAAAIAEEEARRQREAQNRNKPANPTNPTAPITTSDTEDLLNTGQNNQTKREESIRHKLKELGSKIEAAKAKAKQNSIGNPTVDSQTLQRELRAIWVNTENKTDEEIQKELLAAQQTLEKLIDVNHGDNINLSATLKGEIWDWITKYANELNGVFTMMNSISESATTPEFVRWFYNTFLNDSSFQSAIRILNNFKIANRAGRYFQTIINQLGAVFNVDHNGVVWLKQGATYNDVYTIIKTMPEYLPGGTNYESFNKQRENINDRLDLEHFDTFMSEFSRVLNNIEKELNDPSGLIGKTIKDVQSAYNKAGIEHLFGDATIADLLTKIEGIINDNNVTALANKTRLSEIATRLKDSIAKAQSEGYLNTLETAEDFYKFEVATHALFADRKNYSTEQLKLQYSIISDVYALLREHINTREDIEDKAKTPIINAIDHSFGAILLRSQHLDRIESLDEQERFEELVTKSIALLNTVVNLENVEIEYDNDTSEITDDPLYSNSIDNAINAARSLNPHDRDVMSEVFGKVTGTAINQLFTLVQGIRIRREDATGKPKNKISFHDIMTYIINHHPDYNETLTKYLPLFYSIYKNINNNDSILNNTVVLDAVRENLNTSDTYTQSSIENFFNTLEYLKESIADNRDGIPSMVKKDGVVNVKQYIKYLIENVHPNTFARSTVSGVQLEYYIPGFLEDFIDKDTNEISKSKRIYLDENGNRVKGATKGGFYITSEDMTTIIRDMAANSEFTVNVQDFTEDQLRSNANIPIVYKINLRGKERKIVVGHIPMSTINIGGIIYNDGKNFNWWMSQTDGIQNGTSAANHVAQYSDVFANQERLQVFGNFYRAYNDYRLNPTNENFDNVVHWYNDMMSREYRDRKGNIMQNIFKSILTFGRDNIDEYFKTNLKDGVKARDKYDKSDKQGVLDAVYNIINPLFYNKLDDSVDLKHYKLSPDKVTKIYSGIRLSIGNRIKNNNMVRNKLINNKNQDPNSPATVRLTYMTKPPLLYRWEASNIDNVIPKMTLADGVSRRQLFYVDRSPEKNNTPDVNTEGGYVQNVLEDLEGGINSSQTRKAKSISRVGDGTRIQDLKMGDNDSSARIVTQIDNSNNYLYILTQYAHGVEGSSAIPVRNARINHIASKKHATAMTDWITDSLIKILDASFTRTDPKNKESYMLADDNSTTRQLIYDIDELVITGGEGHITDTERVKADGSNKATVFLKLHVDSVQKPSPRRFGNKTGMFNYTRRTIEFRARVKNKIRLYVLQHNRGSLTFDNGKIDVDENGIPRMYDEYRLVEVDSNKGVAVKDKHGKTQTSHNMLYDKSATKPDTYFIIEDANKTITQQRLPEVLKTIIPGMIRNVPVKKDGTWRLGDRKDVNGKYSHPALPGEEFDNYEDFLVKTGAIFVNMDAITTPAEGSAPRGEPISNFDLRQAGRQVMYVDTDAIVVNKNPDMTDEELSKHIEQHINGKSLQDIHNSGRFGDVMMIPYSLEVAYDQLFTALLQDINLTISYTDFSKDPNTTAESSISDARYNENKNTIELNSNSYKGIRIIDTPNKLHRSLFHELLHGHMTKHINDPAMINMLTELRSYFVSDRFMTVDEKGGIKFDDNGVPVINYDALKTLDGSPVTQEQKIAFKVLMDKVSSRRGGINELNNWQEAITYAFSNVVVVNGVPINIAEELNKLDGTRERTNNKQSLLQKILDFINQLFNIDLTKGSVLDAVYDITGISYNESSDVNPIITPDIDNDISGIREIELDTEDHFDDDETYGMGNVTISTDEIEFESEFDSNSIINSSNTASRAEDKAMRSYPILDDEYLPIC